MGTLIRVGHLSEIPPGTIVGVGEGEDKILIANVGGKIHAVHGVCTHEYADLTTGFLMENRITCPLHLSQFDVTTGEVLGPPAATPLRKYSVKIEGEEVYVEVD